MVPFYETLYFAPSQAWNFSCYKQNELYLFNNKKYHIQNKRKDILWSFPRWSELIAVSDVVQCLSDVSGCLSSNSHLSVVVTVFIQIIISSRHWWTGSTVVSHQVAFLCHRLRLTLTHNKFQLLSTPICLLYSFR